MASSKLLSLALFLVLLTHAISAIETSFNFPSFNKDDPLILQGDANISSKGFLRLTDDTSNSVGRAFYSNPIQIKDSNNVANLDTNFTFIIRAKHPGNSGYGLTFEIRNLGSHHKPDANAVAVVFDTFSNSIDIDVNSNWPIVTTPCDFGKYNGEQADVHITYDSSKNDLRVFLLFTASQVNCSASATLHLENEVNPWVGVGFNATSRFETHDVLSWSFSSKFSHHHSPSERSDILLNQIL
uniref:Arcelin-like protein 4 n=1 Tax=Phaseolus vulgaris TaxID=3885 RepID=Q8RVX7_PHAVU|nr:arcelin-like protein 4 [Phaseolus vulgaris]